jgi:dTDP-4-dehydrorhamnose reductase
VTRLLVTGAGGMLGRAVVDAANRLGHEVHACTRAELDIVDADATRLALVSSRPRAVINCAAYTDVDGAESDWQGAEAVNAQGARNVAAAAAEVGAFVVHVSTDYVFDGSKREPWLESDPVAPLGVYGETKLAGERAVASANPAHAIVRTAWLFGAGGRNFVDTMLALGAQRDEVSVVTDQVGCPTWTGHLAGALVEVAERPDETGIHHIASSGSCSWNELALETFDRAAIDCRVLPATSEQFVRPAARPAYSVLGTQRRDPLVLPPWQDGLAAYLATRVTA